MLTLARLRTPSSERTLAVRTHRSRSEASLTDVGPQLTSRLPALPAYADGRGLWTEVLLFPSYHLPDTMLTTSVGL